MNKVLVTGANGFVGEHLVKELAENGLAVTAVGGHTGAKITSPFIDHFVTLDLKDPEAAATVDFTNIDSVIHLAGLAAVGPSFDDPMLYINTNIGIEVNLFEAALAQKCFPKFLIISSGSLYDTGAELPITETTPVLPSSPYAISKLGQEQMARYYQNRGFECIIARPFNHCGPGQGAGFIVPDLAQQLIAVERNQAGKVMVGNLDALRDYTDVRDIARAYRLLLESGKSGETYNICSGTARSGHDILAGLQAASGLTVNVEQDPAKMRPADNPVIYGDHSKLTNDTGWQPTITFEQTMTDVIADWRSR
ncbi:MAG: GDP-mannose 4,6-dehydratase [Patescibacteria group bacterium]|nr:GDP-mannose 4,6-dehydratase [Patescibacteria group bacterium]